MEARNLAAVGLSLMLAANCFMPCYTVAYANDLTYGGANYEQLREDQQERAGNGQVDQTSREYYGMKRSGKRHRVRKFLLLLALVAFVLLLMFWSKLHIVWLIH